MATLRACVGEVAPEWVPADDMGRRVLGKPRAAWDGVGGQDETQKTSPQRRIKGMK